MKKTVYMIIEKFRNGDNISVYRRFRDKGRLAPEGLNYITSWIDESISRCYQIMETHNPALLDQWINNWKDIVEFEVFPVISSEEAAEKMSKLL
ncbi:MAG: DUF3303 domain-containing protein [Ignavibacteria bacterium]